MAHEILQNIAVLRNVKTQMAAPTYKHLSEMVSVSKAALGNMWRERERLSLSAFLGTEDIRVHIVHISRVPTIMG